MKKISRISVLLSFLLSGANAFGQAPDQDTGVIDKILTFWPFVVLLVLLLLAILWYQNIKTMRKGRESGRRPAAGINPVVFLGIVTVFALILLALPWYLNKLDDTIGKEAPAYEIAPENRIETVFMVEGMTCTGCENAINKRVGGIEGVQTVDADHIAMQTLVVYDQSKVSEDKIVSAIVDAGYTVTGKLPE